MENLLAILMRDRGFPFLRCAPDARRAQRPTYIGTRVFPPANARPQDQRIKSARVLLFDIVKRRRRSQKPKPGGRAQRLIGNGLAGVASDDATRNALSIWQDEPKGLRGWNRSDRDEVDFDDVLFFAILVMSVLLRERIGANEAKRGPRGGRAREACGNAT